MDKEKQKLVSEEDESDEEEDEDYAPEEEEEETLSGDEEEREPDNDEIDQERTEKLWQKFMTIPVKSVPKPSPEKPGPNKAFEFAGEKVNHPGSSKSRRDRDKDDKSWLNRLQSPKSSGGRFGGQHEVIPDRDIPTPRAWLEGPNGTNGNNNRPRLKRGGLSFLSGDPEEIGLAGPATKGGLSNVLAALQNSKKQKLGTLEKSRMDWEAFKRDAGIEDELQTSVKSKDGYLDRQDFLQRADLRTFEIEKNIRLKSRRSNPNP